MRVRLPLTIALLTVSAVALARHDTSSAGSRPVRGNNASSAPALTQDAMPATAQGVEELLDRVADERKAAKGRHELLRHRAEQLEALSVARGRALVRLARAGLLPVGGGFDALVDHASQLERLRRALERDLRRYRTTKDELETLEARLSTLRERSTVLEAERNALARSHAAILAAEERELAFRRAFDESYRPDPHTAVYGSNSSLTVDDVEQGFASLKGRLPFPLEGRTEIRQVQRSSNPSSGLKMAARSGAPVRAVYPGRVSFSDEYGDYGLTVLLDHGDGFFTVSGGLGAAAVTVGDEVRAGQRIGRVGSSAGGSALYFELRRDGQILDPAPWFGI